jgi:hypothetical protein
VGTAVSSGLPTDKELEREAERILTQLAEEHRLVKKHPPPPMAIGLVCARIQFVTVCAGVSAYRGMYAHCARKQTNKTPSLLP